MAAILSATGLDRPTRVVLRSGCYVTHDHSDYAGPAPLTGQVEEPGLIPALEVWSEVISVPEPGRVSPRLAVGTHRSTPACRSSCRVSPRATRGGQSPWSAR